MADNIQWLSCFGKQFDSSPNVKIELQHDSAIPFLGIFPRGLRIICSWEPCIQIFTTTLIVMALK
jgi:hypothetical protein